MNISRFEEIEVLNLPQRTRAAIRDFINYLKNYGQTRNREPLNREPLNHFKI